MSRRKNILVATFMLCTMMTYAQSVNMKMDNVPVRKAMTELRQQTGYSFVFESNNINEKKRVNVNARDLKQAINQILAGQNVTYRINGKNIIISKAKSSSSVRTNQTGKSSQKHHVTGTVLDKNGEPIIGATIREKGTNNATITDLDGKFSIDVDDHSVLTCNYIGFKEQDINTNGKTSLSVIMTENNEQLDEVVVVGYGTQRKADLTGSVANISAKNLNTESNANIGQALQGRIAGVDIVSQGGYPGSGTRVMVRGIGTLNNASPLYIVDGMYMSSIDQVNPNDIESIDVLKDASSAAIYGSRAANGVVIITTKSGTNTDGVPKINMSANIGVNYISKKLDMLNAAEWAQVSTAARAAAGLQPLEMAQDLENKEDNDWQDYMFRPALMQNYNLSAQGGGRYSKYYNSFGYTNQEGTLRATGYQRYTIQSKLDFKHGIWNIGSNILLTYEENKPMNTDIRGGSVGRVLLAIPTLAKYDDTKTGGYGAQYGDVVNLLSPMIIADRNLYSHTLTTAKAYANVYLIIEPLKGLKYKLNISPDFSFSRSKFYNGIYDNGLTKNSVAETSESRTTLKNILIENLLTYDNQIGDHKISALAGYSYQVSSNRYLIGSGKGMSSGIRELDDATTGLYAGSNSYRSVLISWLGRVFYSYKDKYLLTATIRRDGSSKFGKNHHWGNFPSVSVGWNISEEPFIKNNCSWLDQLKIRAGYGELGNQEIDNYQYSSVVTTGINYPDGNGGLIQGAFPKTFSSPDIKWESTSMTNIGIDFLALNSRLSLTMDYYVKNTSDILLEVPIPISTGGANDPVRNAGKIRNRGFEFNLGWADRLNSDFSYQTNFIGATNSNKVVKMGTESQVITGGTIHGGTFTTRTLAGYPIGGFWLIPCDGYFNSQEEVDAYQKDGHLIQPSAAPGDIKFKDVNDDGTINDDDRVYCGSPFPSFTYSFNASLRYRNWDFAMTFQGVTGNKIYNATRLELENTTAGTNYLATTLDAWTETNHDASTPRLIWTDPNQNSRSESDRYLESGSYFRLRTVQLGYTLPKNLFGGLIDNCRIYINMDNLFTITPYKGYSPDVNSSSVYSRGFDEFMYPTNRTFMLGINLTF
ncbi:MAG: TonB-dependent receptor [Prevotella sp.]|jgi:TonB-linked SusC/RagA family outer membrane protein